MFLLAELHRLLPSTLRVKRAPAPAGTPAPLVPSPARVLRRVGAHVGIAVVAATTLLVATPTEAQARQYSGIVIDARTGKTLYAHEADSHRFPASLTKMMTLYMVFDALDRGEITLQSRVRFSKYAAARPPSKIGVGAGNSISVEQAIFALVTKSANDVATAVGETLGGTESEFARMMTRKARSLGMSKTTFRNASGLPNSEQRTTARDMARLGLALREHHPDRYGYFSTRSWRIGKARYPNHNRLLGRVKGVDGIKTGYISASGYNLVSSVKTDGRSIVAVVIGGRTGASRNAQMQKLIATYLPRASKRGGGQLIARGAGVPSVAVASLPKAGPSVRARPGGYTAATESVMAFAAPGTAAPAAAPVTREPATREPVMREVAVAPAVDPITTASIAPGPAAETMRGWIIQIAATPTASGASDMHERAFNAAGSALRGRRAFTEQIVKGGDTMHRVRFGGFGSKGEAWAACKALKKRKFGCYALDLG